MFKIKHYLIFCNTKSKVQVLWALKSGDLTGSEHHIPAQPPSQRIPNFPYAPRLLCLCNRAL